MAFSPDGETFAFNYGNVNFSRVRFWDLKNNIEFYELDYNYRTIESLHFSTDGQLLVMIFTDNVESLPGLYGGIDVFRRNLQVEVEVKNREKQKRNLLFQELETYVKNGQWKEANDQTRKLMIKIGDKYNKGYLTIQDIQEFPCQELQLINDLWINNSDGKFGFTVQKQIWFDCGCKIDEYENESYSKFTKQIGWDELGWQTWDIWSRNDPIPTGHLPTTPCGDGIINHHPSMKFLVKKLEECEISHNH